MESSAKIINRETKNGKQLLTIELGDNIPDYLYKRYSAGSEVTGTFQLNDNRVISGAQNRKVHVLIRSVFLHFSGQTEKDNRVEFEALKEDLKDIFLTKNKYEFTFSLSNCSVSLASEFIHFLIEFCFEWGVPFQVSPLDLQDDLRKYLYACLFYRKCAITGKPGEIHHLDAIGAGRDRKKIDHTKHEIICLVHEKHMEAHKIGTNSFKTKYHVYGLKLNAEQLKEIGYRG